jgi:hypothetical protein
VSPNVPASFDLEWFPLPVLFFDTIMSQVHGVHPQVQHLVLEVERSSSKTA